MGIAVIAHKRATGASECGWYLVVYLMDCTLGITLAIAFHRLMHVVVRRRHSQLLAARDRDHRGQTEQQHPWHPWTEALLESGNYGDPPSARRWAIQAAGWVTCVVSARLSVGATVLSTLALMGALAGGLDRLFGGRPDAELFTVMVGIPMLLNVGQAWIQDQVLKWTARRRIKRGGGADSSPDGRGGDSLLPLTGGGAGAGAGGLGGGGGGSLTKSSSGDLHLIVAASGGLGRNRNTSAVMDKTPLLAN
ncbi:hypothetical protein HYH02_003862 [Chlamydomonas schloesseri]|uniref:Uncharacterized protein n=1 Tax=Chlamydomonas schloesseri TaxID=2026947 RepID=A0A835WPG3_9CHLO|nr:hypothetical protein HYH02_003862 [Chlamydomonas schloesseri]|eukprot:KAG2451255.1 hypothetical protein HYH02_003862 [Chlamydomonas schloesseri]